MGRRNKGLRLHSTNGTCFSTSLPQCSSAVQMVLLPNTTKSFPSDAMFRTDFTLVTQSNHVLRTP